MGIRGILGLAFAVLAVASAATVLVVAWHLMDSGTGAAPDLFREVVLAFVGLAVLALMAVFALVWRVTDRAVSAAMTRERP